MATAPAPSVSPVVRAILSADLELPADAVIAKAKAKGVTAPDESIRNAVHNIRSELRRAGAKPSPAPKAAPAPKAVVPKPKPAAVAPALSPTVGVTDVLSNVAQVNAAVAASGGVDQARQVAEAVRACGGPEQFAQYLDLVAGIRTGGAAR
jgi:hypothetical protein